MYKNIPDINTIFDDLDKFRDYCRFNGKVFNEKDLYKNSSDSWRAYKAYLNSKNRKSSSYSRKNSR